MLNTEPLIVPDLLSVPGHAMHGDWALPGREYSYIAMNVLARHCLPGRSAQLVPLTEICAKPGDFAGTDDFSGPRFEAADTRYPGILVQGMANPCDLPYRLIDGRRRLEKLRRQGWRRHRFIVLQADEITPFIRDFVVNPR